MLQGEASQPAKLTGVVSQPDQSGSKTHVTRCVSQKLGNQATRRLSGFNPDEPSRSLDSATTGGEGRGLLAATMMRPARPLAVDPPEPFSRRGAVFPSGRLEQGSRRVQQLSAPPSIRPFIRPSIQPSAGCS